MNMVNDVLFSFGTNCKDNKQPLSLVSLQELRDIIFKPNGPLNEQTKMLRTVYTYSKERYRSMKTQLPFISCSHFQPPHRKYDNFQQALGWIIDIDLSEVMPGAIYNLITRDNRVALWFTSPNGYGLKLLFLFSQPFTDALRYSTAYKSFSHEFGIKYNILDKIDLKNCDVSRISFLCHDHKVGMNPLYDAIEIEQYISELLPIADNIRVKKPIKEEITDGVYKNILSRLGSRPKPIQSDPHVPSLVLKAVELLSMMFEEMDIIIINHEKVQYGMKLIGQMKMDTGEIIIYHGKRGWSVVSSARKELNHDLCEVMKKATEYYLLTHPIN
jgi:hypothetical protein